ncbi:MAG: hypothetical protein M3277_12225 [Actinomycetota bacterium]|nr:hypothetical protein [Actinomycetota bacterium]
MRRILLALVAAAGLALATLAPAGAGPSAGGLSSDNVEWITFQPFQAATGSGAKIIGKHMYVTSWHNFSIYDVSDPLNPQEVSTVPFGFKFENEDVDGNDSIMIFSETTPQSILHVWDVEDKSNPVEIASLSGAGEHTMSCLDNCKWLYGSEGGIIDLRDPQNPIKLDKGWNEYVKIPFGNSHDVNEIGPDLVLTSSLPMLLLDTSNPAKPKLLATSEQHNEFIHSSKWPRAGKDRFALSTGETWVPGADIRCDETSGAFRTWDTTGWQKGRAFQNVDTYRPPSSTGSDGHLPSGNTFGCSTHWFEHHPDFNNGGIVAVTFFNHGTHFMRVSSKGKISNEGWFIPHAGNAAAAEWLTDRIVYSIDLQRGFDVLKYTGKL